MANEKVKVAKSTKKPMTFDNAVKILIGAGIKLDHKTRIQTWISGKLFSKSVVAAGSFLDSYDIDNNNQYRTMWYTPEEYQEMLEKKAAGIDTTPKVKSFDKPKPKFKRKNNERNSNKTNKEVLPK